MDLGCIDMGCIEKKSKEEISPEKESSNGSSSSDSAMATSKIGKNKAMKESGQFNWNALSKCTSQIRKPPRRKTSPLNWFPRRKVDSYLNRKIKLLQEGDGMNLTLDETLGHANLHYSRVLKEKIAVKEAATKAMEARKAAMVEASWCRILKAASIEYKEAGALLAEAEKLAAEAFEAATAIGVTMYDIPGCPQRYCKIESSAAKGGESATHTVSASFETAFEVDKQVALAVKTAFSKLANCSSIKKDDFRELLRKISKNPESDENSQEFSEISSECDSDHGSEYDLAYQENGCSSESHKFGKESSEVRHRKHKRRQVSEKFNLANLAEMMLERLKGLQEDELASLATIVATCGLNAALAEAESSKKHDLGCISNNQSHVPAPRRMSISGASSARYFGMDGQRKTMAEAELPSLDKILVKKLTRLEREVVEAKNARKNEVIREGNKQQQDTEATKKSAEMVKDEHNNSLDMHHFVSTESVSESSKLENEIEEARMNEKCSATHSRRLVRGRNMDQDDAELPSLDKFLVKHMSKLEREVQEAKNRRNFEPFKGGMITESREATCFPPDASAEEVASFPERDHPVPVGKENINLHQDVEEGRTMQESSFPSRCNSQNQHTRNGESCVPEPESLEKILVKHVSRLEREKMEFRAKEGDGTNVRREPKKEVEKAFGEEGLDQILVKRKSRLERERMAAAAAAADHHPTSSEDQGVMHSVARREARQKELQEAWGGLSLGNSMRPHLSRLQRDKAAWLKAEEEDRKRATEKS